MTARPQLCYEDVEVGGAIPPLVKAPTTIALAKYCGAAYDFSPLHFDEPYARTRGQKTVLVQGFFKAACLGQMLTDWIGPKGWVKKFTAKYQRVNYPNQPMTCRGKVIRKYEEAASHLVEVEMWVENPAGEMTTAGTATVLLPTRQS
jgi:acyl dehydratase